MGDWEWVTLWESALVRTAGMLIAAGVIWKYAVYPFLKGVKAFLDRAKKVSKEISEIREHAATVSKEVTPNGGKSMHDKLNKVVTQQVEQGRQLDQLGASFVKYAFDHAQDHTSMHRWLAEEYGVDRRDEDEGSADEG